MIEPIQQPPQPIPPMADESIPEIGKRRPGRPKGSGNKNQARKPPEYVKPQAEAPPPPKPKIQLPKLPDELINAVGLAPVMLVGGLASRFMDIQPAYDAALLATTATAFRAWVETSQIEIDPFWAWAGLSALTSASAIMAAIAAKPVPPISHLRVAPKPETTAAPDANTQHADGSPPNPPPNP